MGSLLDEFLAARSVYRSTICAAKGNYWASVRKDLAFPKSPAQFWRAVRRCTGSLTKRGSEQLESSSVESHFKEVFNCFSSEISLIVIPSEQLPILDDYFSGLELDSVLGSCRAGGAPGEDSIPYDFYRGLNAQNRCSLLFLLQRNTCLLPGPGLKCSYYIRRETFQTPKTTEVFLL